MSWFHWECCGGFSYKYLQRAIRILHIQLMATIFLHEKKVNNKRSVNNQSCVDSGRQTKYIYFNESVLKVLKKNLNRNFVCPMTIEWVNGARNGTDYYNTIR